MAERDYSQELLQLTTEAQSLRLAVEGRNASRIMSGEPGTRGAATRADLDAAAEKLVEPILSVSKRIDKMEANVGRMLENSGSEKLDSVEQAIREVRREIKNGDDDMTATMIKGLAEEIRNTKKELLEAMEGVNSISATLEAMNEKLDEKADKRSLIPVHKRLGTMFIINVAGMISSVMTLGLLSYLIYSIAR